MVTSLGVCFFFPQAIRDGVIEASIDHERGFMRSKVCVCVCVCDHFEAVQIIIMNKVVGINPLSPLPPTPITHPLPPLPLTGEH